MDDIGEEYYGFERQTKLGWEYIDMEDIKKGDIVRYMVPREHQFFGLMFQASIDAFEEPPGSGEFQFKASHAMADPSRAFIH